MIWVAWIYGIGFIVCFSIICYDEIKSFVRINLPFLWVGFFVSFLWPFILTLLLVSGFFSRKSNKDLG